MKLATSVPAVLGLSGVGLLCLLGCYTEMHCRDARDVGPGERQCIGGGGAPEAVVTGAAAAAVWVAGGGCKIGGCHPTLVCNTHSGYCERPSCGEGKAACLLGTRCNSKTHRCE